MPGGMIRTAYEDSEVTRLLREFDRITVRLWVLGVDPSLRVTQTLRGVEIDGVRKGSGLALTPHGGGRA